MRQSKIINQKIGQQSLYVDEEEKKTMRWSKRPPVMLFKCSMCFTWVCCRWGCSGWRGWTKVEARSTPCSCRSCISGVNNQLITVVHSLSYKNKKHFFSNLVVVFVCSEGRANDDEVRFSPGQVPRTARVRPIRLVLRIREKVFRSEDAISIKLNIRKIWIAVNFCFFWCPIFSKEFFSESKVFDKFLLLLKKKDCL